VERGSISIESPLGRGLVGRTRGDEVSVRRPAGEAWYTILAIEYDG
jgi:transcription elongation factor GreA